MKFRDFICLTVHILGVSASQLRAISLETVYTGPKVFVQTSLTFEKKSRINFKVRMSESESELQQKGLDQQTGSSS